MSVKLNSVGHRFGDQPWLFRNLTLEFEPGHIYALTGPSGSGKTTLLGMLAGWTSAVEGSIQRDNVARVGWVFQNPHGVPRRHASDIVAFPMLARGVAPNAADESSRKLMERFGLADLAEREFRALSGGEAQRLMLARAVASAPGLLLVDEPTAQLDPTTAATVNAAIGRLATDGTIVVVATHDANTRDACTDHVDLGATRVRLHEAVAAEATSVTDAG